MKLLDKLTLTYGGAVTVLTYILGSYWYVFVGYLLLNVIDYITGVADAYRRKTLDFSVAVNGIIKKLAYWLLIATSFLIANIFSEIGGGLLGLDLSIIVYVGYFTVCSLIITETVSILKNLDSIGVKVPSVLLKVVNAIKDNIDERGE